MNDGSTRRWSRFSTTTGVVSIIAMVFLVLVFARLGMWQLDRASEKKSMLAAKEQAAHAAPLKHIDQGASIVNLQYRKVEVSGYYDYSKQFLLDNRIHSKQAGYEVITPFYPQNSSGFLLVNRGWIGHNGNRSEIPPIPLATDSEQPLIGLLTNPSKGFAIGEALQPSTIAGRNKNWPLVLQYIDYATIADKLDKIPVINGVVVADRGQNGNLQFNWQPVANGPMKHYGYAFQWFAMLTAVIVFFVYLNFLKKSDE